MTRPERLNRRRLTRQLDVLVVKATRHLRRWSLQKDLHAAVEPALQLLLFALTTILLLHVIVFTSRPDFAPPGFWSGLLLSLCLPLVYLGIRLIRVYRVGQIQRPVALALYDRVLGLKDRLVTADEFLRCCHFGAFAGAAIDDAEPLADRALDVELPTVTNTWQPLGRRPRYYACTAVALMLLTMGVNTWRNVSAEILPEPSMSTAALATEETSGDREHSSGEYPSEDRQSARDREDSANKGAPANKGSSINKPTKPAKTSKSAGTDLAGQAQSNPQVGQSSFKQSGAAGGKAAKSDKKTHAKDSARALADQNPPPASPIPARPPKKPQVASPTGANTSNDPVQTNDQSARQSLLSQNSQSRDKQSAEQKSRAGDNKSTAQSPNNKETKSSQRQLASRSAPPTSSNSRKRNSGNRGQMPRASNNQNNNLGKGRGGKGHGKGALKKSRGVMSMILAVPTPDRIWAQPNPAPIRTTRQRVQPEEKNVTTVEAQDRSPRATPAGHLVSPQPTAWEEQLLRDYFNEQRQGDTGS